MLGFLAKFAVFRTYFDDHLSEFYTKFREISYQHVIIDIIDSFLFYIVKIRYIGGKCYMEK